MGDKKNDLDRLGIFQEPGYITINEPYKSKSSANDLSSPIKRFVIETTKSVSGLNEGYFNTFQRGFVGEAYSDPLTIRREYKKKNRDKMRGVFHLPNVPKKPEGAGSFFGTFSGPIPSLSADFESYKSLKSSGPAKRNFYTNPPKQGTGYGYPNVTLNKIPDYLSEPFDNTEKSKTTLNKPAFRTSAPTEYFNTNVFSGKFDTGYTDKTQFKPNDTKPFHFKPGYLTETINPMPEYKPDLYNEKSKRPFPYVKNIVNKHGRTYYPIPGIKSVRQPSILNQNVVKSINRTNYGTVASVYSL